jgi:hypothetical protein
VAKVSANGCVRLAGWRVDYPEPADRVTVDGDQFFWASRRYAKFTLRSDGVILRAECARHGEGRGAWSSGGNYSGWMRLKAEVVAKGREEMVAAAGRTVLRRYPLAYRVDESGRRVDVVEVSV